jgi:hypothetical protein
MASSRSDRFILYSELKIDLSWRVNVYIVNSKQWRIKLRRQNVRMGSFTNHQSRCAKRNLNKGAAHCLYTAGTDEDSVHPPLKYVSRCRIDRQTRGCRLWHWLNLGLYHYKISLQSLQLHVNGKVCLLSTLVAILDAAFVRRII